MSHAWMGAVEAPEFRSAITYKDFGDACTTGSGIVATSPSVRSIVTNVIVVTLRFIRIKLKLFSPLFNAISICNIYMFRKYY